MPSSETNKLRPIDEQIQVWDGYRGNNRIGWRLEGKRRGIEVFGTWCVHCQTNWGWTPDPEHADRIHRAMKAKGCPRCERDGDGSPIHKKQTKSFSTKTKKIVQ